MANTIVTLNETKTPYIYKPLDKSNRSIRLIILEPSVDFVSDIHCDIFNVPLDTEPQYEALSYTWGDASITKPIFLQGCLFQATVNLVSALRYLRLKDQGRTLWVDAICIDQSNGTEREDQVAFMKNIYSMAACDLLWLGDDRENCGWAGFQLIEHIGQMYRSNFEYGGISDHKLRAFQNALSNLLDSKTLGILEKILLDPPVWKRMWIVQEILISRRVCIYCGHYCLQWEKLDPFIKALEVFPRRRSGGSIWLHTVVKFQSVVQLHDARRTMMDKKEYKPILRLWEKFQMCNATDPRDMIFALLGLADRSTDTINVTYSAPVKEVYAMVVRSVITKTGNLDALCYDYVSADWYPMLPWLPSWVIDFSARCSRYLEREDVNNTASQTKPCSIVESAATSSNLMTLTLRGVKLGRIVEELHMDLEHFPEAMGGNMRTFIHQLPDWIFVSPKKGMPRNVDRLARSLLGQLPLEEFNPPPPSDAILVKELAEFLLFMRSWKSHFIYSRYKRLNPSGGPNYLRQILEFMIGRIGLDRFCLDGPLMARVPRPAKKDDIICVLWGSKVPHVLRPVAGTAGTYQLIGRACVEGYMTGKAVRDLEAGVLHEEIFALV